MGRLFRDYVLQVLVAVTVTATVTVAAVVNQYWHWPNAVVGASLLLSTSLYLTDRLGLGPSLRSRVRRWLDESGYKVQTVKDSSEFHFILEDNIGLKTAIIKAQNDAQIAIVVPNLVPNGPTVAVLKSRPVEAIQVFWKNVRRELLRYGVSFSDLTLDGVTLSESFVVGPSLTGPEFMKRVLFVRSAARLFLDLVNDPDELPPPHAASNIT